MTAKRIQYKNSLLNWGKSFAISTNLGSFKQVKNERFVFLTVSDLPGAGGGNPASPGPPPVIPTGPPATGGFWKR